MKGGMDFPDDIPTNVFRIGDIKEIHWAFYTRRPKDESALQNRPSSVEGDEEEDSIHLLHLVEYALREDRHHVFLDEDESGVWLFSLYKPLDEGIAWNVGLDDLESIAVGSVRSGELVAAISTNASASLSTKTARSTQSSAAPIGELNAQAYGLNAGSHTEPLVSAPGHQRREARGAGENHSVAKVYSKFVSAISCSLSHFLGKRAEWIQFGPYGCIDVRTLGDDIFDNPELHSWVATTNKMSFDVKWLSSGDLLISSLQVRLPRHTRMSLTLSKDKQSTALAVGSPLLLLPYGINCQYLGIEEVPKNDIQRKSTVREKAAILSQLAHRGISNVQDGPWVQVQMGRESNVSVHPSLSLWPAELCLCEDAMTAVNGEDRELLERSIVVDSTDPLEEAESWFLGKAARMEALQARLQEENEKAQVTKDTEDTDDEDTLSLFESPMDQGITPQDVSGIYPTPPDGLPLALLGSSNPNNIHSGDDDNEEKELQPSDETHGGYDEQENEDLFGDMDIDMFASNGLTEADFSFFDDPSLIDEGLRETDQAMTEIDTSEITDQPLALDGRGLTTTPQERRDSESDKIVAENHKGASGGRDSHHVSPTTDECLPDKDNDTPLESTVKIEDVDYAALEQLNLHWGKTSPEDCGGQRGSFEHVPFKGSTFSFDDKYNIRGRFAFDVDELPIHPKHRGRYPHCEDHPSKISHYATKSPLEDSVDTGQLTLSRPRIDLLLTDDGIDDEEGDAPTLEDSDEMSDAKDSSMALPAEPSRKRKREQLGEDDHPATPSSSIPVAESPAGSPQNGATQPMSDSSQPRASSRTKEMVNFESQFTERSTPSFTGRGQAFVEVAQFITHIAGSGLLCSKTERSEEMNILGEDNLHRSLQTMMTQLLSTLFPSSNGCSLKEYVSLGEKNLGSVSKEQLILNQRNLKPANMAGGLTATGRSIFKLDSPYIRVQRNGVSTELSASALSFWEELSLGPAHGTKDVDVFCVCPENRFIEEGVMTFLNMIKGAYQSCNLGSHDLGDLVPDYSKRILTTPMDVSKPDNLSQNIAITCERLGLKLSERGLQSGTTVVYIINPFNDQQYLPGLCDALLKRPNAYRAALEKQRLKASNEMETQIVPLELVWSPQCIVVPSPADYKKLAFEVYDKCRSFESGQDREPYYMSAPAIRLAKAIPKTIDFKLGSDSPAPFMQSDNCVHVAYTWDATNRWLAAWWTDNLGVLSWHACYCLGKNDETPWKPLYETFMEILDTSFEMSHPRNAPWRLFICKDHPIARIENEAWLRALADSIRPSTSCTILTVEAQPLLAFPLSDLQRSSSGLAPGLLATPGATPHTNAPSPDISGLGSTPAGNSAQVGTPPATTAFGDQDSEARLIDVTDETWGVVMDGTLGDLSTLSYESASVASGYLVKRAGPRDGDGFIPLGVNLVHGQKPYRAVLKEVLGMYRNLNTLARVRGVVDPVKSVLPLHVAAVRKAWKAVSETMRYEPE